MNEERGKELVSSYLDGFSESLDATLGLRLLGDINSIEASAPEMLTIWLGTYPVHATISAEPGAGMAILLETAAALRLLAILEGKEESGREDLTDDDRESLTGLLGAAHSSGVTRLLHDAGRSAAGQGQPEVADTGEAGASALGAAVGARFVAAQVTLTADPGVAFDAMVIYSEAMEAWPAATPNAAPGGVLSPDEMNDILRGFGGDSGSSLPPMRDDVRVPGNMDMVLDIRLRATARLGSIEMPLGDVLSFGPGTIIDVGRLVDEPVDLLVNNKLIARGDIVVVDEKYGLRITEIISPRERIESLR